MAGQTVMSELEIKVRESWVCREYMQPWTWIEAPGLELIARKQAAPG